MWLMLFCAWLEMLEKKSGFSYASFFILQKAGLLMGVCCYDRLYITGVLFSALYGSVLTIQFSCFCHKINNNFNIQTTCDDLLILKYWN